MAERQPPYVPAKTLSTEYPVSVPCNMTELILNAVESLSTAIRMCHCSGVLTGSEASLAISSGSLNMLDLPIIMRELHLQ